MANIFKASNRLSFVVAVFAVVSLALEDGTDHFCKAICGSQLEGENEPATALESYFQRQESELRVIKENLENSSSELATIRQFLNNLQSDTGTRESKLRIARNSGSLEAVRRPLQTKSDLESYSRLVNLNSAAQGHVINHIPSDCEELRSGLGNYYIGRYYTQLKLGGDSEAVSFAGCELRDDTGWTIVQKRIDGSLSFDRSWDEYKHGFGNPEGDFWLGNEKIHRLTNQKRYKLRIELQTGSGRRFYAQYNNFRISDEADNYRLILSEYVGGSAGDAFTGILSHNGSAFSTRDRDNDKYEAGNCAIQYHGGWWFHSCFVAFLNGILPNNPQTLPSTFSGRNSGKWLSRRVRSFYVPAMVQDGIVWRTINRRQTRDSNYYDDVAIRKSTMMVAPRQ